MYDIAISELTESDTVRERIFSPQRHSSGCALRRPNMRGNSIFYIIGVIVVIVFVLKFLGLW